VTLAGVNHGVGKTGSAGKQVVVVLAKEIRLGEFGEGQGLKRSGKGIAG